MIVYGSSWKDLGASVQIISGDFEEGRSGIKESSEKTH
jgi:hypothetical protein